MLATGLAESGRFPEAMLAFKKARTAQNLEPQGPMDKTIVVTLPC